MDIYLQFDMVLSDVSALLVDGDYTWNQTSVGSAVSIHNSGVNFFPVIDKCGVILKIQQVLRFIPCFFAFPFEFLRGLRLMLAYVQY